MLIGEREVLIWLYDLAIGNSNINKILNFFPDLMELWACKDGCIFSISNIRDEVKQKIVHNRNIDYLNKLFETIEKNNIGVITIFDDTYPYELKKIIDYPKVLFCKGNIDIKTRPAIGIVGSRKATSYGRWACEKFVKELVQMGITIVSGLASGIDAIAHRTALDNGGNTIAVLGNGIDIVYPKSNKSLYRDMEDNGLILSEFPINSPPMAYNFPQRNRIIAGLSLGIIVVEAQTKSGSLITAHQALDQGKDVFAIPGNINSIFSSGTNKLIRDGARPLLEIEDIVEEIQEIRASYAKIKRKNFDDLDLSGSEIKIIEVLEEGPLHSDLIAQRTNMDISTVISILTILELKDIVKELSNRIFVIN